MLSKFYQFEWEQWAEQIFDSVVSLSWGTSGGMDGTRLNRIDVHKLKPYFPWADSNHIFQMCANDRCQHHEYFAQFCAKMHSVLSKTANSI